MKCPIDDSPLSVSARDGVEIDFCPQCRGVWLDRGELDKIIDRAANTLSAETAPAAAPRGYDGPPPSERYDDRDRRPDRYDDRRHDDRRYDDERRYDDRRRRKKRSFLDDLFDFD